MLQHKSSWFKGNPKGSGSGRDREKMEDRDTGSILVDYQTEGLETRVQLLILVTMSRERDASGYV